MATATMTNGTVRAFGPLQIAIAALVAATALAHIWLGFGMAMIAATQPEMAASMGGAAMVTILAILFCCNFAGYVVLATGLRLSVLRRFQGAIRWLLIGYTALTIVAYFALAQGHAVDLFGLSDKAIEAALIVLLVIEGRRAR